MNTNTLLHASFAQKQRGNGLALSPEILTSLIVLLDLFVIMAAGLLLYILYVGWTPHKYPAYFLMTAAGATLTVAVFYMSGLYQLSAVVKPVTVLRKIMAICTVVFLAQVVFLFGAKVSAELSRVWIFSWFITNIVLIMCARFLAAHLVVSEVEKGGLSNNLIVVGGGIEGMKLLRHLVSADNPCNRIVGIFDDRSDRVSPSILGYPVLGNVDDLITYVRNNRSDEILLTLPWQAQDRIQEILRKLDALPVHVCLGPDPAVLSSFPQARWRDCAGLPVVEISKKPIAGWQYVLKQAEDWLLGGLALLVSLPIMLVVAVLVKMDSPGPVFFRQRRYGFNDQLIEVWKFRTMYADKTDHDAETLTRRNDRRVTRIGGFLRRSSLDELPQIFNVIKGEMSLVGPRPHALKAKAGNRLYQEVVEKYASRHKVKPGITGWAQVNGWRGETDSEHKIVQRIEHDLYYINHWSLLLDIEILIRTIGACFRGENAY